MATSFTRLSIEEKLRHTYTPDSVNVINESGNHAGHAGREGKDEDDVTHINIVMRASHFNGKSRIQTHREIYALLDDELESGLHAIALDVKGDSEA